MTRAPLISDLIMELDDGSRVTLPRTADLPPGLPGMGANDGADRAPDSDWVVRSGDEIPQVYTVTVPMSLHATDPTALLDALSEFENQLGRCRKLWRADRCYLPIAYALLPPPEMGYGWLSCKVAPVFKLARLGWFTEDGRKVFG